MSLVHTLKKAFDTVDHKILLEKLHSYTGLPRVREKSGKTGFCQNSGNLIAGQGQF